MHVISSPAPSEVEMSPELAFCVLVQRSSYYLRPNTYASSSSPKTSVLPSPPYSVSESTSASHLVRLLFPILLFLNPLNISSASTSPLFCITPSTSLTVGADEKPNPLGFGFELHAEGRAEKPLAVVTSRLWFHRVPFTAVELCRVRLTVSGQSDEVEAF